MKRFILGSLASVLIASQSLAVPLTQGFLSDYINLGPTGGTIGSTQFSDFTLLPLQTGATQISPNSVLVNPINSVNNPSLVFTLDPTAVSQTALAGQLFELRFSYNVSDLSLTGAGVSLVDAIATGDAAVTGTMDLTGPIPAPPTLIAFAIEGLSSLSDQTNFASVQALGVITDIVVDGGVAGQGSLGSATNQFAVASGTPAIPEPTSAFILLTLSGLLVGHRRSRRCHSISA